MGMVAKAPEYFRLCARASLDCDYSSTVFFLVIRFFAKRQVFLIIATWLVRHIKMKTKPTQYKFRRKASMIKKKQYDKTPSKYPRKMHTSSTEVKYGPDCLFLRKKYSNGNQSGGAMSRWVGKIGIWEGIS